MSSNSQHHIPFVNRIIAFLLTPIFIVVLIFAYFSLPVELVFFNPIQYLALLDKNEYKAVLPQIVSDTVINQLVQSTSADQFQSRLFQNAAIKTVVEDTIPEDWVQSVFSSSLTQIFDFINFRTPYTAIEIDLDELKNHYINNSNDVAQRIYESLPNCSGEDLEYFSSLGTEMILESIPICKPPEVFMKPVIQIIQDIFEDSIRNIPEDVRISGIIPIDNVMQENLFNRYSLLRWGLRLLPILAIALFIGISILLRQNRSQMLRWCGKTLVIVSVLMLILLTVLLIGFDQFIAMVINRYLVNVIPGFGNLLLKMAQDIGYLTLIWVVISVVMVLGFGLLLLLIAKVSKPKIEEADMVMSEGTEIYPELSDEITSQPDNKEILPETLEEIEENEKKEKKSRKK